MWLHLTGEVDKSVRFLCEIFSGFNSPKKIKSVNLWQSYSKNKKGGRFLGTQCIVCNKLTTVSASHSTTETYDGRVVSDSPLGSPFEYMPDGTDRQTPDRCFTTSSMDAAASVNVWPSGLVDVVDTEKMTSIQVVISVQLALLLLASMQLTSARSVFTARCYAFAVLAMVLCPSVRLSVRHKSVFYRNGRTNRAGFGIRKLPSTCPKLC